MMRHYNRWHSRFDQPDPHDGSYSFANPQSFNRYVYVENDPVNLVDPTGLDDDDFLNDPGNPEIIVTNTNDRRPFNSGGVGGGDVNGVETDRPDNEGGEGGVVGVPEDPPNKLPDCVRKFLSQFGHFDQVVDAITYSTDGIPWYVPMDARAFTLGDHIYFAKGEFDPSNGVSDREMILLAHEVRHVNQYRWYGKKTLAANYLWESAKLGLAGLYLGGTAVAFHLSYYGNEYEQDASSSEEVVANQ